MNIFLDTSSLFKLYHREADSILIEHVFSKNAKPKIFLSELTKIEFISAIRKKVRSKDIDDSEAQIALALFESDFAKYTFIPLENGITVSAKNLVIKYGSEGL